MECISGVWSLQYSLLWTGARPTRRGQPQEVSEVSIQSLQQAQDDRVLVQAKLQLIVS